MTSLPILPVDRLLAPFREFARINASSGVLLMGAAAIALLWANSPIASPDEQLWATTIREPVAIGVVLGLVVGKQLGITLAAVTVVRSGIASLPTGVGWRHCGAAWLGGIGFTMSLFIGTLAYGAGSPEVALAKIGILAASIVAGIGGFAFLRGAGPAEQRA